MSRTVTVINAKSSKMKSLACIILLTFLFGCASAKSAETPLMPGSADFSAENVHAPWERSPGFTAARRLVFIGLDGWGGAYVSKAKMPTVKRMMAGGSWTLKARCIMPSYSLPNWTALFSGTPPEKRNSANFPTIFTLVRESGPGNKPAFFYEWDSLRNICTDEEAEKINIASDRESALKIASYIEENKPVFTAVVFNQPDEVGFWGGKEYYAKLAEMDSYISIIEEAVRNAGIYDDTVFVLSADHGGVLFGHGFNTPRQRKIPLVIFGRGIKGNYEIRPRSSIIDIAPTMAAILGLQASPEWTGKILTEVFK